MKLKTAEEVEVGDVIEYEAFGGTHRIVKVTEVEADIKNGKPGFSGIVSNGADIGIPVWGYCYQIVRYISHA